MPTPPDFPGPASRPTHREGKGGDSPQTRSPIRLSSPSALLITATAMTSYAQTTSMASASSSVAVSAPT
jgi:hypothetical protein